MAGFISMEHINIFYGPYFSLSYGIFSNIRMQKFLS